MKETVALRALTKTFPLSAKQRLQKSRRTLAALSNGLKSDKLLVAVDSLSLSAYEGEVFGLLGPNGAGKTTTLRMLAALIRPDSGDALLGGDSILTKPEAVRRKLGFLTADLKLEEFFTPSYLFDFFAALREVPAGFARQRKAALFSRFGVDEFAHTKTAKLSTGMKQKVSLLVSLVHDPDIVVFDEPTNGLDLIAARTVAELLMEMKVQGKTVILSTHIFSLAEKVCDRAGFLINGKLEACDTLERLTARPDAALSNASPLSESGSSGRVNLESAFFALYDKINDTTGEDRAE